MKKQNDLVEILKKVYPSLVIEKDGEHKVDIEKLKLELAKSSDIINEGYSLNWLGQSYSRVLRDCPATTLIKPDKNHNQLPENINSDNVYIEGDNLEVLKHLKNAYSSKIKMIYIDPPYNTGSDGFVYNDSFNFDVNTFMRLSGLDKEEAEKVLNYTKSKRNSHSAWLTFMYPRLYIARQLLKDDGVIFISIDDHEQAQLKLLCDQIFGEENFIADLIWANKEGGGSSDSRHFRIKHEYILVYGKLKELVAIAGLDVEDTDRYKLQDEYVKVRGKYQLIKLDSASIQYSKSLDYPILAPDGTNIYAGNGKKRSCWRWGKGKHEWGIKNGFVEIKKDSKNEWAVYTKQYLNCDNEGNIKPRTLQPMAVIDKFSTTQSNKKLGELLGKNIFNYSKPVELIKHFLQIATSPNDIILDFFSGSSTTADAVMQLNTEDNGNRKFIMVQLPEEVDEKNSKEAYEFCTKELKQEPIIPTIAKERIKRAANKIKEDNKDKEYINDLDLGFKVYKTIEDDRTDVSQLVLFDVKDGIKTEVDDLDALLTTWVLHDGYDLNTKVEEIMINKYKGYCVKQTLYLLDKGFSTEDLLSLVEKLNDPKTPLINQIILNSSNFANRVLLEFHENVFSKNSKEAKIVVEDR